MISAPSPASAISLRGVSKTFRLDAGVVAALQPLDLDIARGEAFGIIGRSGAGKSTLIRLLNRLELPSSGTVTVDGHDLARLDEATLRATRRHIGMIFQHFNLLASRTAASNVAFPLELSGEMTRPQVDARVRELLQRVGLGEHAHKYPAQLSGGQKQRVGIARALACRPGILLCDEATSALDPETTRAVLALLAELRRELDLTLVLITHEMDVIRRLCDRVAVLEAGCVVESGTVADVFLHPQHAVTRSFVREAEHLDELDAPPRSAPGERVVRLTMRGALTHQPLLSDAAKATGSDLRILQGRVDRIGELPYGQFTVALPRDRADAALALLRERGAEIEELPA